MNQSPLLSTVNYLSLTHIKPDEPLPAFSDVVPEDISTIANAPELKDHPDKRKKWLADQKSHEGITLGPDVMREPFLLVLRGFATGAALTLRS